MRLQVQHGRVQLSVRCANAETEPGAESASAPKLLLLHELLGSSDDWGALEPLWPGEVFALDFCGHGASDWLPGRGYTPELFVADADCVLATLADEGTVRVAGAGMGAYVGLLLAGARPDRIHAALLLPGRGFAGGGPLPRHDDVAAREAWLAGIDTPERKPGEPGPDPLVARCDGDIRPVDYAEAFAEAIAGANRRLLVGSTAERPAWLTAAMASGGVADAPDDPASALRALAEL